jgi:hypothetical protein
VGGTGVGVSVAVEVAVADAVAVAVVVGGRGVLVEVGKGATVAGGGVGTVQLDIAMATEIINIKRDLDTGRSLLLLVIDCYYIRTFGRHTASWSCQSFTF